MLYLSLALSIYIVSVASVILSQMHSGNSFVPKKKTQMQTTRDNQASDIFWSCSIFPIENTMFYVMKHAAYIFNEQIHF